MNDLIDWLINIEHTAGEIYGRAALYFSDDEELKSFLLRMVEDEAWHFHIMGSAAESIRKLPLSVSAVSIDQKTDDKINGLFQDLSDKMESGALTKDEFFDAVISAEFSEWNDLFIYVVNSLKESIKEFSYIASRIQNHKRRFELFFENNRESSDKINSYKNLNPIWTERILIVDDEDAITSFLEALLENEGLVDKASNGLEALELVKINFYKLIISDIDMPVMDGISFFKAASELNPDINERIIFFTGGISEERRAFLTENNLNWMTKPSGVSRIREKVLPVLLKLI